VSTYCETSQRPCRDCRCDECAAPEVSVLNAQGAEFLSDPCIVMGCIYHYGHDGEHEVSP
jgi:hypothetical protein